jgi:hypothetical protein
MTSYSFGIICLGILARMAGDDEDQGCTVHDTIIKHFVAQETSQAMSVPPATAVCLFSGVQID